MDKSKIENCKSLKGLFEMWKEHQRRKRNENTNVFISDGYINEKKYKNILFVLKESHYFHTNEIKKEESLKEDSQVGFYRDFLCKDEWVYQFKDGEDGDFVEDINEEKFKKCKMCTEMNNRVIPNAWYPNETAPRKVRRFDNIPKQKEKIARMAEYILHENITSNYEILKEALESVAFMNINKMGGGDTTDSNKLLDYYKENKEFIKQQISILNPDVIVLMVNSKEIEDDLKKYWDENIKKDKKQKFVKNMLHTAARGKHLVIKKEEIECFNNKFAEKYNIDIEKLLKTGYQVDAENYFTKFNKEGDESYLRFNKSTLQYLIKFIYNYENSEKGD